MNKNEGMIFECFDGWGWNFRFFFFWFLICFRCYLLLPYYYNFVNMEPSSIKTSKKKVKQ